METKDKYNTTQLNPETTFERHVFHRDQFAHYLRWTHILKIAKIGQRVLDFGCGSGNLLEVFYRNRFKCVEYLGLDVRDKTIAQNNEKFGAVDWAKFEAVDLCAYDLPENFTEKPWEIIASFEVIEHIQKKNGPKFLQNVKKCMDENTKLFISTPCYDEKVGAASNHIIDGEIAEFSYDELAQLFKDEGLEMVNHWGTFASMKDYKPVMNDWQEKMFEGLKGYYDSNLISNIMAPFFPQYSRNVLWELKLA